MYYRVEIWERKVRRYSWRLFVHTETEEDAVRIQQELEYRNVFYSWSGKPTRVVRVTR